MLTKDFDYMYGHRGLHAAVRFLSPYEFIMWWSFDWVSMPARKGRNTNNLGTTKLIEQMAMVILLMQRVLVMQEILNTRNLMDTVSITFLIIVSAKEASKLVKKMGMGQAGVHDIMGDILTEKSDLI